MTRTHTHTHTHTMIVNEYMLPNRYQHHNYNRTHGQKSNSETRRLSHLTYSVQGRLILTSSSFLTSIIWPIFLKTTTAYWYALFNVYRCGQTSHSEHPTQTALTGNDHRFNITGGRVNALTHFPVLRENGLWYMYDWERYISIDSLLLRIHCPL